MVKRLLFILLLVTNLAYSQAYMPLPDDLIIFRYEYSTNWDIPSYTYNKFRTEFYGDTTIGAVSYRKAYEGLVTPYLSYAVRNDIPARKVYKYSFSSGSETLLYDFDLNVGDTIYHDNGPWGLDTIWVTMIDNVVLGDGLSHRRFNFDHTAESSLGGGPSPMPPSRLIEGLGYEYGNIYPEFYHHEFENTQYDIYCASSLGVILKSAHSATPGFDLSKCSSELTSITDEAIESGMLIHPNPSSGKFELSFETIENRSIEIFDVLGQRIYTFVSNDLKVEVDLSSYPSGIYHLGVIDGIGGSNVRKIIKQ